MKNLLLILLFAFFALWANAQQDAQFSMNMFNHMTYNPGFAGSNGMTCAQVLSRNQWTGFDNAPSTLVFNAHTPLDGDNLHSGVGINVISDKIGFEKNTILNGSYAVRKEVGNGILGVGMSLGMVNKALNGDWVTPESLGSEGGSDASAYNDNLIPYMDSKTSFDMSFGMFYRGDVGNDDDYWVGLSSTHINRSNITIRETATYNQRHLYLTGGYNYMLPTKVLQIKPSFLISTDGSTTQYCLNTILVVERKFWGGISYRGNDAVIALLGFDFAGGYGIGYAYDFTTSQMRNHSSGSHEILIRYCFLIKKSPSRTRYVGVRNPA